MTIKSILRTTLFYWESRVAPLIAIYFGWLYWPFYIILKRANICFVVNIACGPGHTTCELDLFFRKLQNGDLDPKKKYIWIRKRDRFSTACIKLYGNRFWYAKASYFLYELTLPLTIRYKDITQDSGLSGLLWQLDSRGKYIRPIPGQNYLNLMPLGELTELWNGYFKLRKKGGDFHPLVTSDADWGKLEKLVGERDQRRALIHLKEKKANATALPTDPTTYFKTLDYLRSKKIQIVFVGREKMPDSFREFSVIDYAGSKLASFEHDIALFQSCYLAIVAGSGVSYLADAAQKPYLYINSWHLATPVFSPLAVIVPTLLKKPNGDFLTFREQIDLFLTTQSDGTVTDLDKFIPRNATEDDIYAALLELEALIANRGSLTPLQEMMRNLKLDMPLQFAESRYSQTFLERYDHLLK